MLTALSNLPKWVLALVVACVLTGYAHAAEDKLTGCKSTVTAAQVDGAGHEDDSAPQPGDQSCQCSCHFTTLSPCESPMDFVSFVPVSDTPLFVWIANAPEAPCADIEHPPQLV